LSTTTGHRGRRFKRVGRSLPFASLRPGVRTVAVSALAAAALAAAPVAVANDFQQVYDYYKHHGTIPACRFSEKQLRNAERQTPPDVEQYAPSFLDSLGSAREGSGNCSKKAATPAAAPAPTPPTSSTPAAAPTPSVPTPTPQTTPQPVATAPTAAAPAPTPPPAAAAAAPAVDAKLAAHESSAPVAVITLAGLAALAVIAALGALVAWWLGWSPRRPLTSDDRGREFMDWLRFG
jgi:hypothetical protein